MLSEAVSRLHVTTFGASKHGDRLQKATKTHPAAKMGRQQGCLA
jgi:hypothetical protein